MNPRTSVILLAAVLGVASRASAQFGPPPPVPHLSGKEGAPEDITGYWVSVITEDWRWRMLTPAKGDFTSVPLNPEGIKVTQAWDPAKDLTQNGACKAYGAPGLMRLPTRLHITWQDDNTLQVEADEGTQTRLFHFGSKPPLGQAPSLQGWSAAEWDISRPTMMGFMPLHSGKHAGSLKVITTSLKPGYLRKNGIPYGADTVLTEYFTRTNEPDGESWLLLTTIVEDPQYLASDFLISSHFKKEADGSKWHPSPCRAQ